MLSIFLSTERVVESYDYCEVVQYVLPHLIERKKLFTLCDGNSDTNVEPTTHYIGAVTERSDLNKIKINFQFVHLTWTPEQAK